MEIHIILPNQKGLNNRTTRQCEILNSIIYEMSDSDSSGENGCDYLWQNAIEYFMNKPNSTFDPTNFDSLEYNNDAYLKQMGMDLIFDYNKQISDADLIEEILTPYIQSAKSYFDIEYEVAYTVECDHKDVAIAIVIVVNPN